MRRPGKDDGSRIRVRIPESPSSLLDRTGLSLGYVTVLMYVRVNGGWGTLDAAVRGRRWLCSRWSVLPCAAAGAREDAAVRCPCRNRCLRVRLCRVRGLKTFLRCHCALGFFFFSFVLGFFFFYLRNCVLSDPATWASSR